MAKRPKGIECHRRETDALAKVLIESTGTKKKNAEDTAPAMATSSVWEDSENEAESNCSSDDCADSDAETENQRHYFGHTKENAHSLTAAFSASARNVPK